jgi:hypothetical protein
MRKIIIIALIVSLSLAGIVFAALNIHFTNYPELEDAFVTSGISETEYKHRIYDCREYSAVMDFYLKSKGFDSGLCLIAVAEDAGHRINWVRINGDLVFVEPQCNRIMTLEELPDHYENMTWIKLYDFDNGEDIFIKPTETGEYII